MSWSWLYGHLLVLVQTAAIVAPFLILERLFPAERQPLRAVLFNAIYGVTAFAIIAAHSSVYVWLTSIVVPWRAATFALPHVFSRELGGWDLAARFVVYLAVVDFLAYWRHRALHRWPLLWRLHKLHHSDTAMNAMTSRRDHWLNEITYFVPVTIPAMILFGPLDVPLAVILLYMSTGFFNHANLRLQLGPLTPLVSGPQYHRIHHSTLPQHLDRNFAGFFPVLDILFGTYYRPQPGEFPATGLASGERIDSQWQGHLEPLYWRRGRPAEARPMQAAE